MATSVCLSYMNAVILEECGTGTAVIRDDWSKQSAASMDGRNSYNSRIIETDPAFWKFFDFDFIGGAPFTQANFESGIREAVLSESVARVLFGSEQAVGKDIKLDFTVFRVCGVVKDISRFAKKAYADIWIPYTARRLIILAGMKASAACSTAMSC